MSGNKRDVIARRGAAPAWLAGVLAVVLLVVAGYLYRTDSERLGSLPPIQLPVPLKNLAPEINGWVGQTLEIPATTRQYMEEHFADDYISRRYVNSAEGRWADLYVVYCSSRPAALGGHRPGVCYPNNGWIADEEKAVQSEFVAASGATIPCLVHRFHKEDELTLAYRDVVVLSFYILNGRVTLKESEFSDLWGRRLNMEGDPTRYVAQVQVSSVSEESAREAISGLVDAIFALLPDEEGNVQAAYASQRNTPDSD